MPPSDRPCLLCTRPAPRCLSCSDPSGLVILNPPRWRGRGRGTVTLPWAVIERAGNQSSLRFSMRSSILDHQTGRSADGTSPVQLLADDEVVSRLEGRRGYRVSARSRRFLLSLAMAAATVHLAAISTRDKKLSPLTWVAFGILAFVTFLQTREAIHWGKLGVSNETLASIDKELEAIIVALDDPNRNGPIILTPWYSIGLHVWVIPRRWRTRPGKWLMMKMDPEDRPKMEHLCVRRAKADIKLSSIRWTIDRGTIGTVWRTGQFDSFDFGKYKDATEADWVAAGAEVRRGLTYANLVELREKYGSVLVVPLSRNTPDEELIGCLVLDTPAGREEQLTVPFVISLLVETGKTRIAPKIP